jgi:hypothetical protein
MNVSHTRESSTLTRTGGHTSIPPPRRAWSPLTASPIWNRATSPRGAVGLILPGAVHIAPVLVPLAATCIAVVMAGAVLVHLRRKEGPAALPAVVLFVVAIIVAWGRFSPYSF